MVDKVETENTAEPKERKAWSEPKLVVVEVADNTGNNGGPYDEGFGSGG